MNLFNRFKQDVLCNTYVTKETVIICFRCYLLGKNISPDDVNILENAYFVRLKECNLLSTTD